MSSRGIRSSGGSNLSNGSGGSGRAGDCDVLGAALRQACAQTGTHPELRASPSSGGLHPVTAHGHRLRTDHAVSAAKYGAAGALSAELDLGAALAATAALLAPRQLRPAIINARNAGGSEVDLVLEPAPTPRAGRRPGDTDRQQAHRETLARAVPTRRSHRAFHRTLGVPVPQSRPRRSPTGQHVNVTIAPVHDGGPITPAELIAACAGQDWVGDAAWAALISTPEEPTAPAAWAAGAAAFEVHLEAHATGLGSCIIGAVAADAPQLWGVDPAEVGVAVVVVAGMPAPHA